MSSRIESLAMAVQEAGLDGWLLCDFRRSNPIAHGVLQLDPHALFSRRWFYYIPATGTPVAIVSAVEPHVLGELPGVRHVFRTWRELHDLLRQTLAGARRVAMEYSPDNAIPVVARVDAGTVELIRGCGVEVISSANLAQRFEAVLSAEQIASHREAARRVLAAKDQTLAWLRERLIAGDETITEFTLQERFGALTRAQGLDFAHGHIVAVNAHAGDPHYETSPEQALPVRRGDLLLLDFTGRLADRDDSVIADYTWMSFLGDRVPDRAAELFAIICRARDAGLRFLRERAAAGQAVLGYEADDVVRGVIDDAGYGAAFVHRTGHNIGTVVHGNGTNLDNLETHDDRLLLPDTCFSVEPGIYLPESGVRTEVNVLMLARDIEVTGVPAQTEILPLLR